MAKKIVMAFLFLAAVVSSQLPRTARTHGANATAVRSTDWGQMPPR
jgi:hypothetical protein